MTRPSPVRRKTVPATAAQRHTPDEEPPVPQAGIDDAVDLRHDSLGYTLKRAQIRTYEALFALLGPDAISPARMTALSIIAAQPGINQTALAEQLRVTRANVVKVVDTLEGRALVERQAIPGDRRSYSLVLTAQGRAELLTLREKTQEHERNIAAALTAKERGQLIALLERVALPPASAAKPAGRPR